MLSACDFSCDFVILNVIFCDFKGGVRKKICELPLARGDMDRKVILVTLEKEVFEINAYLPISWYAKFGFL